MSAGGILARVVGSWGARRLSDVGAVVIFALTLAASAPALAGAQAPGR